MPPDADVPGLGAPPLGPPPLAPATVEAAVGRMEVVFAVVVAFPAELPVEVVMLPDPVTDPLPEADADWLAELGAEVMVVCELLLEKS